MRAENGGVELFGKEVSELQDNVLIGADKMIHGTLHYVEDYTGFSSKPAEQSGNYLALTVAHNNFEGVDSVKIGLIPTYISGEPVEDTSGFVELINDPDKNIVLKIHDNHQRLNVLFRRNGITTQMAYGLGDLVLESE